jgi:hypothetical protein
MKTLYSIAQEINDAAAKYKMGQFQETRRKIRGLSRIKDHRIFTPQTTHDNWAFHSGGRTELQFNIGFEGDEREWFRYGVAFSLEASQTLPKPIILKSKILKLNDYLCKNAAEFEDLRFWYYSDERSPTLSISQIPDGVIKEGSFLFWGTQCPREAANPQNVLFLFDRLLELYRYVEGGEIIGHTKTDLKKGFVFRPGCTEKPDMAISHSKERTRSVALRHNEIQLALYKALCVKYGQANVGTENDTGRGSRIDLVVRNKARHFYYEIKPYPCVRTCIREAIGQLLEYSYWPGGIIAAQMIIVSDNPLTPDAARYLKTIQTEFSLPVFYQYIDLISGVLHEPE